MFANRGEVGQCGEVGIGRVGFGIFRLSLLCLGPPPEALLSVDLTGEGSLDDLAERRGLPVVLKGFDPNAASTAELFGTVDWGGDMFPRVGDGSREGLALWSSILSFPAIPITPPYPATPFRLPLSPLARPAVLPLREAMVVVCKCYGTARKVES